jgi:hypothetical protein
MEALGPRHGEANALLSEKGLRPGGFKAKIHNTFVLIVIAPGTSWGIQVLLRLLRQLQLLYTPPLPLTLRRWEAEIRSIILGGEQWVSRGAPDGGRVRVRVRRGHPLNCDSPPFSLFSRQLHYIFLVNMGLLNYTGFLGNSVTGGALEALVCAASASGFLLFGYDRMWYPSAEWRPMANVWTRGYHVGNHHGRQLPHLLSGDGT